MDTKERASKRHDIYNTVLIELQLMPFLFATYGDAADEFRKIMIDKLGECTEEDENWFLEQLDWFVKRNSEPKKKRGRENDA